MSERVGKHGGADRDSGAGTPSAREAATASERRAWRLAGDRDLFFPPPIGVGIVNVTDDSFFSGARSVTPEGAVRDGMALVERGFEMLDVGAVAARSGPPVPASEEIERLVPAVAGLAERSGVPVAADTFSPEVAAAAADAGAAAINDIGGGRPEMLEVVAQTGAGYVLMHIEGPPRVDRPVPSYPDVVDHLARWFAERIELALDLGVAEEQIALDPGLDFDLDTDHALSILRRLGELRDLGRPLFVALSRKDFLGALAAGSWEHRHAAELRGPATAAAAALAVSSGAEMLRLHDAQSLDALRIAERIATVDGAEAAGGAEAEGGTGG